MRSWTLRPGVCLILALYGVALIFGSWEHVDIHILLGVGLIGAAAAAIAP